MISQEQGSLPLTYELLNPDYYLICTLNTGTLQLSVACYNHSKVRTYCALLKDPLHTPTGNYLPEKIGKLLSLDTCENIFKLAKAGGLTWIQSSQLNMNGVLVWSWTISKGNYKQDVRQEMTLEEGSLNQVEELKFENALLKKKLQEFSQIKIQNVPPLYEINEASATEPIVKIQNFEPQISAKELSNTPTVSSKNVLLEVASSQQTQKQSPNLNAKPKKENKSIKKEVSKKKLQVQGKMLAQNPVETAAPKKKGRRKKMCQDLSPIKEKQVEPKKQHTFDMKNMIKISFENGDYYYGQIKNNLYHGHGIYFSLTNGTFQGEWQYGKANGYGVSKDPQGNQHSGYYINDKRNGKGIDVYTNGQKYSGNFELDAKCGFGKYIYSNGDCYEGEWKNDMYHGKGKQNYADGSSYEGVWTCDEKDGEGVFKNSDGKKFKQVWTKGVKMMQTQL